MSHRAAARGADHPKRLRAAHRGGLARYLRTASARAQRRIEVPATDKAGSASGGADDY